MSEITGIIGEAVIREEPEGHVLIVLLQRSDYGSQCYSRKLGRLENKAKEKPEETPIVDELLCLFRVLSLKALKNWPCDLCFDDGLIDSISPQGSDRWMTEHAAADWR